MVLKIVDVKAKPLVKILSKNLSDYHKIEFFWINFTLFHLNIFPKILPLHYIPFSALFKLWI